MRIGHGYDVHKVIKGNGMVLGGVAIDCQLAIVAHSDGDLVLHALMDALLGACGLGDIGEHFPDSDPQYKDISSLTLLQQVMSKIAQLGYQVGNIDMTVIAQQPKLKPYKTLMQQTIANALAVTIDAVNIKATTTEGLGFTGRQEGIACHAVVLLVDQK